MRKGGGASEVSGTLVKSRCAADLLPHRKKRVSVEPDPRGAALHDKPQALTTTWVDFRRRVLRQHHSQPPGLGLFAPYPRFAY